MGSCNHKVFWISRNPNYWTWRIIGIFPIYFINAHFAMEVPRKIASAHRLPVFLSSSSPGCIPSHSWVREYAQILSSYINNLWCIRKKKEK